MKERQLRSIVKTISWRVTATLTTAGLVYVFTGELALAAKVGLLEVLLKMLFYYLHERVWARVSWGRPQHPLARLPVRRELTPEDMEVIRRRLEEMGYL